MAAIPALKVVAPTNKKRTVGRKANGEYRTREHLTEREVERLRTIQGYLGHKSIQHTVRYTELAPTRFKGLWRD